MTMKCVKFLLISIIVAGCAVKSRNDSSVKADGTFEIFFKEFSRDSVFQSSRIKFPLKHSYYEDYGEALTDGEIKAEEWKHIDFRNDSLASTRKEDAYSIEIIKNDLGVEYLRKGIDNGISMSFHFEKEGAQWFLIKIVDRSN